MLVLIILSGCKKNLSQKDFSKQDEKMISQVSSTSSDNALLDDKNSDVYAIDFGEKVKVKIPLDELNAEVPIAISSYGVKLQSWEEGVEEIFFQEQDDYTKQEFTSVSVYQTETSVLTIENPGIITFATSRFYNRLYPICASIDRQYGEYNGTLFEGEEDLPFMPIEQAKIEVLSFLEELGLSGYVVTEQFTLAHSKLQVAFDSLNELGLLYTIDEETREKIKMDIDYMGADDSYYFILSKEVEGIPVFGNPHGSPDDDTYVLGTIAYVVYSADGVEFLNIEGEYAIEGELEENEIISLSDAFEAIQLKYNQLILDNNIIIEGVEFMYTPMITDKAANEFYLLPTWVFSVSEEMVYMGETGTKEAWVIINAVTGREII